MKSILLVVIFLGLTSVASACDQWIWGPEWQDLGTNQEGAHNFIVHGTMGGCRKAKENFHVPIPYARIDAPMLQVWFNGVATHRGPEAEWSIEKSTARLTRGGADIHVQTKLSNVDEYSLSYVLFVRKLPSTK